MKDKTKTYVLDTSVLINDPDVFYKLGDNQIIIPTAVIKEIDGLKRNPDPEEPRTKAARKVSRMLDRLGSSQDISTGAKTYAGSTVRISTKYKVIDYRVTVAYSHNRACRCYGPQFNVLASAQPVENPRNLSGGLCPVGIPTSL